MGNSYSNIQKAIVEEFERVLALGKNSGDSRDFVVLDQVLKIERSGWENYPVDFSHIGTLFSLDHRKSGKFELRVSLQFPSLFDLSLPLLLDLLLSRHSLTSSCPPKDFAMFAEICKSKEEFCKSKHEFESQMQAYFTLKMWTVVAKDDGEDIFVNW